MIRVCTRNLKNGDTYRETEYIDKIWVETADFCRNVNHRNILMYWFESNFAASCVARVLFCVMILKITHLKLLSHLLGANDLIIVILCSFKWSALNLSVSFYDLVAWSLFKQGGLQFHVEKKWWHAKVFENSPVYTASKSTRKIISKETLISWSVNIGVLI